MSWQSAQNTFLDMPDLSKIKLIDYDFAKYGSSAERKRLLGRWTTEVKSAPK